MAANRMPKARKRDLADHEAANAIVTAVHSLQEAVRAAEGRGLSVQLRVTDMWKNVFGSVDVRRHFKNQIRTVIGINIPATRPIVSDAPPMIKL